MPGVEIKQARVEDVLGVQIERFVAPSDRLASLLRDGFSVSSSVSGSETSNTNNISNNNNSNTRAVAAAASDSLSIEEIDRQAREVFDDLVCVFTSQ